MNSTSVSFAKIKLLQNFLDSLTMEFEDRVCVGLIENGVYGETGATIDDSEGLVDYARAIDGVEVGVLIEDRAGAVKGSLRAKDPKYRVDQIAKKFGGGGHACRGGSQCRKQLDQRILSSTHASHR